MSHFRTCLAVATVAAAVALPAAPAAAASPGAIAGGGSFARTIPFIDGNLVAYECHVVAPGALSTSVTGCVLKLASGSSDPAPPSTSAGATAFTYGAVSAPLSTYQVCWTGSATYSDGSTQTTSGCSTSSSVAGAGAS